MAGGSDGSVIIDTTLDNSGFEKGSEKMKRSIQGLVNGFNSVGASAGKGIQQVTANAQEMARAIEEAAKGAQGFDNNLLSASSTAGFSKEMSSAEKSCASLEKQMQRLGESERMGIKTNAQMTRFHAADFFFTPVSSIICCRFCRAMRRSPAALDIASTDS